MIARTTHSEPKDTCNFFGICPYCTSEDFEPVERNVERCHYLCCDKHEVFWLLGSDLFSYWRHENPAIWEQNARLLSTLYREVECNACLCDDCFEAYKEHQEYLDSGDCPF